MRRAVRDFVRICAEQIDPAGPVYEFGSYQVQGQEDIADLRPLFPSRPYVGADMRQGPGVDILLDLHHIDLPDGSIKTALLLDTLEHVEFPKLALEEIHRVLGPDGLVVISSVMNFKIHGYPQDFWRFTPEGFTSLLSPFAHSIVAAAGDADFPHTVVGIGCKSDKLAPALTRLGPLVSNWSKQWSASEMSLAHRMIKPFVPPVIMGAARKLRDLYGRNGPLMMTLPFATTFNW